jgi:hypothetical protein
MPLSRRSLLGSGIGGIAVAAIGTMAGCSSDLPPDPAPDAYCVDRGSLITREHLGGARLVYDISGTEQSFRFDQGFYRQLDAWLEDYLKLSRTSRPDRITTFGSWLDGQPACDSWHDAGRAFDLSRLAVGGEVTASCRYDVWKDYTGARLRWFRTRYWALAASLHLHFAYVLTYLYNEGHHNHIHIDNGRSGEGMSEFSPRSPSQVQAVQAMLTHIWGRRVPITGDWDDQTQDATGRVLDNTEVGGTVDDGADHWHTFLRRTASHQPR